MGGGDSKQTTTTNSAPWPGAQPALNTALSGAQKLYDKGVGAQVYSGSTVVPWADETTDAMGGIEQMSRSNLSGRGLSGQYQNVINNGGFNSSQLDALKNTRNLANSTYSVSPELQAVLDQTGAQVANQVNLGASAAGRYGGGLHQGAVAKNVGEITNNAVLSDYQNFQGRRDAANNSLFGMGQQGFGNLGTAYTGMQAPAQDLMTVGSMEEDLKTRNMNDKLRIFSEQQNLPWENVSRLNAIASGAGSLGGTTRQTQPGQNPFLTALGYGATGAGLLGGFL